MTDKPEEIGLDAKDPATRDRVDLAHEMAGLETGRIKRFLADGASGYAADTDEKKAKREYRSLLDMLLAEDPQYAALYNKVSEKVIHASRAVDQALIEANQRLDAADRELRLLRESAAELPDGTKVFHSDVDGNTYTEHGTQLSTEEARDIQTPDDAPSWEEYRASQDAHESAAQRVEKLEGYRDTLDAAEERLNDPNNPYSKEELEDLNAEVDVIMSDDYVRDHDNTSPALSATDGAATMSAAHEFVEDTELDVPDLSAAFDQARVDIPDFTPAPAAQPLPTRTPV